MVDFNIIIKVDTKGAKKGITNTQKGLKKVGTSADDLGKKLKQAFAFGAILVAIRSIQRLADTFTNIQNRLRTVTNNTTELNTATKALFEIANRTRSSFEATAEIYSRVGLATKDLGISQKQTLEFTESLNQAVILSGASAQEAQAGLIQLGQGLASGALRGDELRSVLEQLPVVADVIAKSMKITRGELRILGSEGKISAEIVLNAFKEAKVELADRFAKSIPTIGQAFTILQNNIIKFVGAINEATGASRVIVQILVGIAQNLDLIGIALVSVTAGFVAFKLPAIIAGFQGLAASTGLLATSLAFLAANPIVLIVAAMTGLVLVFFNFRQEILSFLNSVPVLSEVLTVLSNIFKFLLAGGIFIVNTALAAMRIILEQLMGVFQFFGEIATSVIGFVVSFFTDLSDVITDVSKRFNFFIGQFEVLAAFVEAVVKVVEEFFDALVKGFKEVIKVADVFLGTLGEVQTEIEETAKVSAKASSSVVKDLEKEKKAGDTTANGIRSAFRDLGGAISEPIASGVALSIAEFSKLESAAQNTSSKIKSLSFSPSSSGDGGPAFGEGQAGTGASFFSDLGKSFSQTGKIAQLGGSSGGSLRGGGGAFGSSGAKTPGGEPTRGVFNEAGGTNLNRLTGFAQGGSFKVGGSGGVDSQDVRFKASPDETITVTKPGQEADGGGKRPIIVNFNITTDNADSFKLSQKQIISTMATEIQRITEGE